MASQWSREYARLSDDITGPSCLLASMSRSRLIEVMRPCVVSAASDCHGVTTTVDVSVDPMCVGDSMLPRFGTFLDQVGLSSLVV